MPKIINLPADSSPTGDDYVVMLDSTTGTTRRVLLSSLQSYVLANDTVTDDMLDYPRFWQEIGRTTLGSAGDTISVASLPARKYLMFVADVIASGAITTSLRFNNDSGANYGFRYTNINTVGSGSDAVTSIGTFGNSAHSTIRGEVLNIATRTKLGSARSMDSVGASRPGYVEFYFSWNNTSAQINRIDLVNTGGGDFATGSELVVLGHN